MRRRTRADQSARASPAIDTSHASTYVPLCPIPCSRGSFILFASGLHAASSRATKPHSHRAKQAAHVCPVLNKRPIEATGRCAKVELWPAGRQRCRAQNGAHEKLTTRSGFVYSHEGGVWPLARWRKNDHCPMSLRPAAWARAHAGPARGQRR